MRANYTFDMIDMRLISFYLAFKGRSEEKNLQTILICIYR